MGGRLGGVEWLCPFVLMVFSDWKNENSRSRRENGPATANVRGWNLERKKNLKILANGRVAYGNKPRTRVASETRPTARIMAPARGGTWCLRMVSTISWKARVIIFCRRAVHLSTAPQRPSWFCAPFQELSL